MVTKFCFYISVFLIPAVLWGQRSQRITGRVADKETHTALVGVSVMVTDAGTATGGITDTNGVYRIDSVPVGKHNFAASYLGYTSYSVADIPVTSAKEVVLNIDMEEEAINMKEVVVSRRREHINDMALVSTKTFDVQETERYAGSRSDPARMASNFAGAQGGNDSRNDIVIRGNSPQGVLWRLEGIDIPNPNHFSIPGTTGGPVSMLNSKTLSNSDFFTGAFPAEYGNAVAGVFDLKLRNGNSNRHEFTAQLGFLGTEMAAEGPISRKAGSSYLVSYRYSTLQLFEGLHIKIGTASVPRYQDATFKLNFPMGKKGNLSFFGIGGTSSIDLIVSTLKAPSAELYGESDRDQYFTANTGFVGAEYTRNINASTYMQITIAQTGNEVTANHLKAFRDTLYQLTSLKPILGYDYITASTVAHWYVNKKISARQTLKFGVINNYYHLNLLDSSRQYPTSLVNWQRRSDYVGGTNLTEGYLQYKIRFANNVTVNGGLHSQYLSHNGSVSVEPRLGMRWAATDADIFTAGYGLHSQMQQLYQYFAHLPQNAATNMHNYNVGFTRSHHLVAAYERTLSKVMRMRLESYMQYLFDVPVEKRAGSSYSVLNQGSSFSRDFPGPLQNTGKGYNYGLELTLEKRMTNGYYYMLTGSLFDSKATGNDGVYRSTDFNTKYAVNLLAGYEHKLGTYSTFLAGAKVTFIGGKLYSPVDTAASSAYGDVVVYDSARNTLTLPAYFRADLKIGAKFNSRRVTHEIALDLVNVLNTKNVLSNAYSADLAAQGKDPFYYQYQLGFLPIFYYRVDFGIKPKK
ncbi:MAG: TonB-dependent receptor [Taibaiella sp.]|nr:TonB-dependent receptor [Taibaiella sp.]